MIKVLFESMRKHGVAYVLLLAIGVVTGCASGTKGNSAALAMQAAQAGVTNSAPPPVTEYLNVGDTLNIVYNDLPIQQPPSPAGQIGWHDHADSESAIPGGRQTRSQLEREIRDRYVPDYLRT